MSCSPTVYLSGNVNGKIISLLHVAGMRILLEYANKMVDSISKLLIILGTVAAIRDNVIEVNNIKD